jgi:hypothetical protein
MKPRLYPLLAFALVAFATVSWLQVWEEDTGFTKLIRFGEDFSERALPELQATPHYVHPNSGYDGQFYAQMALRPLVADAEIAEAVDATNYRFRRILPSWLAWLGGLGQTAWVLQAYAILPIVAWLGLAIIIVRCFLPLDSFENLLRWFGCLFGVGAVASVEQTTPDLIGAVFVLLAVAAYERKKENASWANLAAALLCKESFLIAGILRLDGFDGGLRAWWNRLCYGLLAVLPLALWMGYLWMQDYPPSSGSPRNFTIPGSGLWFETKEALGLLWEGKNYNAFALLTLIIQAVALLAYRRPDSPLWRVGVAFIGLAFFLGEAVWEADPGAAYRVLLPIALAFNLCLPSGRKETLSLLLLGNLSVLVGLKYVLGFWWE